MCWIYIVIIIVILYCHIIEYNDTTLYSIMLYCCCSVVLFSYASLNSSRLPRAKPQLPFLLRMLRKISHILGIHPCQGGFLNSISRPSAPCLWGRGRSPRSVIAFCGVALPYYCIIYYRNSPRPGPCLCLRLLPEAQARILKIRSKGPLGTAL